MKDRKKIFVLLLPITVLVFAFLMMKVLNRSYALNSDTAKDVTNKVSPGETYNMVRKNTYSWHLITHNFNSKTSTNASGTKLIQAKNNNSLKAVVYCATEGKTLSSSANRYRYAITDKSVKKDKSVKNKLSQVMPYMYPYVTLSTVKENLKSATIGLNGTDYQKYKFDDLNVNETVTAVQAAIWNIIEKKSRENGGYYYQYRTTVSSFSGFSSCKDYYENKILTTEEEAWYNESGCDKNGKFYKYVFNHEKTNYTENRINVLIDWYVRVLSEKLVSNSSVKEPDFIELKSTPVFSPDGTSVTVEFNTNIESYTIIFRDDTGNQLLKTDSNPENKYTITNINPTIGEISVEVQSKSTSKNVYWYIASNGQDFVGLENTYYTAKENFAISTERGKIILYKVGNSSKNVEVTISDNGEFDRSKCGNKGCLSNVKFELYYKNKTNLVRRIEVDYANENTFVLDNLPPGVYYLKETQPAYGYDIYNYGVGDVDSEGFIKIDVEGNKTSSVLVNNNYTKMCFAKVDEDNQTKILEGAKLVLEDIDGAVYEEFWSSEQEGNHCIEGSLQAGTYYLYESQAPSGYTKNSNRYEFVVGRAASGVSELADKPLTTRVTPKNGVITITNKKGAFISKSDMTTGACVEGAKLTIKDKDSKEVDSWVSTCKSEDGSGEDSHQVPICTDLTGTGSGAQTENGKSCLGPGTYTLIEEIHPEGYATAESITFTIDNNGKVAESLNMEDAPIVACILKTSKDKGNGKGLAGAEFEIYKENGDLYQKFTSKEEATCFPYMPTGTYTVREVKAPKGYKISKIQTKIVVKDTAEKQMFEIENEVEAPKTAMDYSQTVIIISSIFMLFGLGLVGYYVFKKQN